MTFEISNLTVSKSPSKNIDLDHKSTQFSEIRKYKKKYDSSAYSLNNSLSSECGPFDSYWFHH